MRNPEIKRLLHEHVSQPRSLQHHCRYWLRRHLGTVHAGKSILPAVTSLTLPPRLKSYLLLKTLWCVCYDKKYVLTAVMFKIVLKFSWYMSYTKLYMGVYSVHRLLVWRISYNTSFWSKQLSHCLCCWNETWHVLAT